MSNVKFNPDNATEHKLILQIAQRAAQYAQANGFAHKAQQLQLQMSVAACHCNGNPLRLDELLAADDFNFAHDVFGIHRHINPSDGSLSDNFTPRFRQH